MSVSMVLLSILGKTPKAAPAQAGSAVPVTATAAATRDTVSLSKEPAEKSGWDKFWDFVFGKKVGEGLTRCGDEPRPELYDGNGDFPDPSGIDLPEDPNEPIPGDDDTVEGADDDTAPAPDLPTEHTEILDYDPANPEVSLEPVRLQASELTGNERVLITIASDPQLVEQELECLAGFVDVTEEAETLGTPIPAYFIEFTITNLNAEDEALTENYDGAGIILPAQCGSEGGNFSIEVPTSYINTEKGTLDLEFSVTVRGADAESAEYIEGHTYQLPVRVNMEVE